MDTQYIFTSIIISISIIIWIFLRQRAKIADAVAREKRLSLETYLYTVKSEVIKKDEKISILEQELSDKKIALAESEARMDEERRQTKEKLNLLDEQKNLLKMEFKNLANSILEEKSKKFTEYNKESVNSLISPLKQQLTEFKKKVEDVYDKEAQGRAGLVNEITHLKNLNLKISQDAVNLTNALKGSKTQGIWGELALERLLEMAGLQKGREYELQVNSHNEDGKRFLPDAIVNLPKDRKAVIDAKMSLTAYERYCSSDTNEEREIALKNHLQSIKNHIKNLSSKEYEKLEEVNTIDIILMFIPIESAYITAIKEDNSLFKEAISKNILLTCPSTLLMTLRTIAYMWKSEYQNKNTMEIARKATALYDKFCGFINSLQSIGDSLRKTSDTYNKAIKQLSTGNGSLIKRIAEFEKFGIKGKKSIPDNLVFLPKMEVEQDSSNNNGGDDE